MSIQNKLRKWAEWSNNFDCGTGFKPIWEAIERNAPHVDKDNVSLPKSKADLMHDDDAVKVDAAVAAVSRRNPVLARIIVKAYLRKNTIDEIAQFYLTPLEYPHQASMEWDHKDKLKVDPKVAKQLLKAAHQVIALELSMIETKIAIKRKL